MGDPHKEAMLILGNMKGKPEADEMSEDDDSDEGEGLDAAAALEDMFHAAKSGDFEAAAAALKAAMMACGE